MVTKFSVSVTTLKWSPIQILTQCCLTQALESLQNDDVLPEEEVPTDTPIQPEQVQQPSTEGQQEYIAPGEEGFVPREGALGAIQDIAEATIRDLPENLYEGVAPIVGVADTAVDTFNLATGFNVPKLPEYEEKATQAVRNISGLVLPSLGLRGMAIQAGTKLQAAVVGLVQGGGIRGL